MSDHSRSQGIPGIPWAAVAANTDTEVSALAGVTAAANKVPYFTSSSAAATSDFTSFARTFCGKTAAVAVTGSKGSNAALTSLVAALVSLGLITDGTS